MGKKLSKKGNTKYILNVNHFIVKYKKARERYTKCVKKLDGVHKAQQRRCDVDVAA